MLSPTGTPEQGFPINDYVISSGNGEMKADGSITLIKGSHSIIVVDTGLPVDKDFIVKALANVGLETSSINVVVGTHGHSDHIGNLNIFPADALLVVNFDICKGDTYFPNDLSSGGSYRLDAGVEVLPTPGHTEADVSVIVRNTELGTVAVVGDLFEREADIEDPAMWQANSRNHPVHEMNRRQVAQIADYIIPGHGPMFKMTGRYRELLGCSDST